MRTVLGLDLSFSVAEQTEKTATEYSTFHISLFNIGYFCLFWPNVNHRHQISTELPIEPFRLWYQRKIPCFSLKRRGFRFKRTKIMSILNSNTKSKRLQLNAVKFFWKQRDFEQ